jgi:hypothetical protein
MTCPQCLSVTGPDAACRGSCGRPADPVSQFPRRRATSTSRVRHRASTGRRLRPAPRVPLGAGVRISGTTAHGYLVLVVITVLLIAGYLLLRSGWGEFPFPLPVAHEALLLAGTGVQFVLVLAAFLDVPLPGLGRETGAYLAVAAAALAALPAALPAVRPRRAGAGSGSRRPARRR